MVGLVVVLVRIVVVIGRGSRAVAVTVMVSMRLDVIVGRLGVAVGRGEKMNRKPGDVKHQRERHQPPGGLSDCIRRRFHKGETRVLLAGESSLRIVG